MSGSSARTCSELAVQGSRVSFAPCSRSLTDDAELDPGVDPDHVRALAVEADRLRRGDGAGEVGAVHAGLGGDPFARLGLGRRGREDAAAHSAAVADVADQGAGVDAVDRRDAAVAEPVEPTALGAGDVLAVLGVTHDDAAGVDAVGLHRRRADPVVADQRVGEDDDLACVGGIGDRLLVAGHRRVEDDLAGDSTVMAAGEPVEPGPVLEQQVGAHAATPRLKLRRRKATWPAARVTMTRPVRVLPAHQEFCERLS